MLYNVCNYLSMLVNGPMEQFSVVKWLTLRVLWSEYLEPGGRLSINISSYQCRNLGGVGGFSKVVVTFNHVGGSFDLILATTGDV